MDKEKFEIRQSVLKSGGVLGLPYVKTIRYEIWKGKHRISIFGFEGDAIDECNRLNNLIKS